VLRVPLPVDRIHRIRSTRSPLPDLTELPFSLPSAARRWRRAWTTRPCFLRPTGNPAGTPDSEDSCGSAE